MTTIGTDVIKAAAGWSRRESYSEVDGMSQYWEYKIDWVPCDKITEKFLNKLGREGWELTVWDLYGDRYKLVFKRLRAS